jgi:hypothetical protein
VRLGELTKLLEANSSMPVLDPATGLPRPTVSRGFLRASNDYPGEVDARWLGNCYHLFIGYVRTAGFDGKEAEDVIVPLGMVPVMIMHQSKGLEFRSCSSVIWARARISQPLMNWKPCSPATRLTRRGLSPARPH